MSESVRRQAVRPSSSPSFICPISLPLQIDLAAPGSDHQSPPVVQTLAGISTDIHHVVGNVAFDCFSSTHSRFEEVGGSSFMMHCRNVDGTNSSIQSALKIFRVGPTDHSQMDRVNNVRYMFPQILLLRLVVDTLCS